MFTSRLCLLTCLLLPWSTLAWSASSWPTAGESPQLGRALTPEQAAATDFVVLPNGDGLPEGSGNAATGEGLFQIHCLACHGEGGVGGVNDRLVGGRGSIDSSAPVKTVGSYWPYATTLFDYLRKAMPYQTPGSLTNDELYSLTAYVLYLNDIVAKNTMLDAESLPRVEMPNRDGFEWAVARD